MKKNKDKKGIIEQAENIIKDCEEQIKELKEIVEIKNDKNINHNK